jgi:aspartate racemase
VKSIGLLGGMSWESSAVYYRLINQLVQAELGDLHSAKCILYSVDFAEIERLQSTGDWVRAEQLLAQAARNLEAAGAEILLICTNTMHKVFAAIESAVTVPVLHIADVTARKIAETGIGQVGLLGTRFTMEEDFFKQRLLDHSDIETIIPKADERQFIDRVIYEELCVGQINEASRQEFIRIANSMHSAGINGLVLGCTEIGLLLKQEDVPIELFDTTLLHVIAAVSWSLGIDSLGSDSLRIGAQV